MPTTLIWHDSTGGECSANVRVTYSRTAGCAPSFDDPGSPDEVEIIKIVADDGEPVPQRFYTDETLIEECVEHWAADEAEAAEWRAQCRRDDRLMGYDA